MYTLHPHTHKNTPGSETLDVINALKITKGIKNTFQTKLCSAVTQIDSIKFAVTTLKFIYDSLYRVDNPMT